MGELVPYRVIRTQFTKSYSWRHTVLQKAIPQETSQKEKKIQKYMFGYQLSMDSKMQLEIIQVKTEKMEYFPGHRRPVSEHVISPSYLHYSEFIF